MTPGSNAAAATSAVRTAASRRAQTAATATGPVLAALEQTLRTTPLDVAIIAAPLVAGALLVKRGFEDYQNSRK